MNVIDKASHWQLAWSLLVDMEQHHLAPSIVTRCTTMTSYRSTNTVNGWQGALNILTKTHEEATEVTAFFGRPKKSRFFLCFRYFCGLISVCVCVWGCAMTSVFHFCRICVFLICVKLSRCSQTK